MKNLSFTVILISLLLVGCTPDRTTNETSSSSTTFSDDTFEVTIDDSDDDDDSATGYGDGTEEGYADAGQTEEYITIDGIITHSALHDSNTSRSYLWSSYYNLDTSDQGMFYTNSRFNVRVRPQEAPPKGNDSSGEYCKWQEYTSVYEYTQLDIEVCLRKQTGTCVETHTFENVPINEVSKVKEFDVPVSASPLVIEILDVKWDTGCLYDRGLSDRYCPTYSVWEQDCVEFDIQFSTDYTKDFPLDAPRE